MTQIEIEERLNDVLQWATNESSDAVMAAMSAIINLHLLNTEEFLPTVLCHLSGESSWPAVSSMMEDLWTDAVGTAMGDIGTAMSDAARKSLTGGGVKEGIAA